jgi:hypothetical protein
LVFLDEPPALALEISLHHNIDAINRQEKRKLQRTSS